MNLNELTYNQFFIDDYERFLLEVFNINLNKEDVSYLDDSNYQSNIINLFYYGSFMDDDFNDIELYVIKLRNIEEYKPLEDVIYNLLSLNQTNHAFVTVYSEYSDKWFFSYLFLEYVVENNKLVYYKSKIDDFIHWCGLISCEDILSELLSIKISDDNLKDLLKNNYESALIRSLSDIIKKLDEYQESITGGFDSYQMVIKVLLHIINKSSPRNTLMKKIYDKIMEKRKSTGEDIDVNTIYELYSYLNSQESISNSHIKSVCEDTLIEYLIKNTIISREDITSYVKYAYDNRNLVSKHIDEAIRNSGRTYVNMKIPLSIIYNIDTIQNLLDNIKILDFSVNSSITINNMIYLITKLKYVNKIIQGYDNPSIDNIFKQSINDNVYMITLNKMSITTAKTLLNDNINILFTDALNLYDEYQYMTEQLEYTNLNKTKTEVINQIVNTYNKTHFHTKMNINFEENFKQKHGYEPLIYALDFKDVFKDNHKFDLIISNIEHVDLTGNKEYKKQLRRYKLYDNNQRYEYYFIEKALDIIDDKGIISLIINDEYKSSDDRRICKILKQHKILQIDNQKLIYAK
ncbi:MAG: hypothetical protein E7Z86_07695 [Methanosphaera stadtmanae]|nr:hypothetical protein [Methanosphaera stadtmanae]